MPRKNIFGVIYFFVGLIILSILLSVLIPKGPSDETGEAWFDLANSYSPTPKGFKAFWDLLKHFEIPAERFEKAPNIFGLDKDPSQNIYLVLKPDEKIWKREVNYIEDLQSWVFDGGILILAIPDPKWPHLQWEESWEPLDNTGNQISIEERNYGDGKVVIIYPSEIFYNSKIDQEDHAWQLFHLVTRFGPRAVVLDEFYHGLVNAPSLLQLGLKPPWIFVSFSFLLLALVFILSKIFHFGIPLKEKTFLRPRHEFLNAMAGLYQKAGDPVFVLEKIAQGYIKEIGLVNDPLWKGAIHSLVQRKENLLREGVTKKELLQWTSEWHQIWKKSKNFIKQSPAGLKR